MANRDFTCEICGAEFGARSELDKHNMTKHPDIAQKGNPGRGPKERDEADL